VRVPFPINPWTTYQVLTSPAWTMALLRNGMPITANLAPYAAKATQVETAKTMILRSGGSHTWDELKRLRDRWKRAFVVKGILHPHDAERAVALGADGIIVSNHGGRQLDGVLSSARALPAIAQAIDGRIPILADGGIRSGLDVVRMLALGADFVLMGRAWMYAMAAEGGAGVAHVLKLLDAEMRVAMALTGCTNIGEIDRSALAATSD